MNAITKDQWTAIEKNLSGLFGQQKFQLGPHEISVVKSRVSESKLALIVYIDGSWKGKWMLPENDDIYSPIVKQVWRKRSRALYPPKKRASIVKNLGVRQAKKLIPKLDQKIEHYVPDFNTAKSLIRQFKKVEGLTLLEEANHEH
ncbi:hypothetical protein [Spongiibacter sp. UBA1325]|uniref:hypothetical protein n=1 Tax=Spongiibacter sp. UBA1325 TaxID=1947543 RepID=UPI00257F9EFB|nr:hypothetical protein [Spongiibacter sp. UBA1325]|tara:strand:+ start:794 stop:1228 length:435 start_codon:yes stop_codon:yes gene_type:complete